MITLEYLRSFRFAGYALFDLSISFLGIYLLSPLLSKLFLKIGFKISRKSWLFLTLPLGIIAHLLAGSKTQMTKDFLDMHGHYILKITIVILAILGMKDIKMGKKGKG
jgi:hypothetical protein